MQVFLVGFMGAGKSSLGKRLAAKLNLSFVDMDTAIESENGMSINEIFAKNGETHFRQLERDWIDNLDDRPGVYALGGGTPCQDGIMDVLREKGVPVYIKVKSGVIVSRLMSAQTIRPLIEPIKNDQSKMLQFVENKLQEREPYYLRSKIIFESTDFNAEKLDLLADLASLSGA